jgi:hypothetical protein
LCRLTSKVRATNNARHRRKRPLARLVSMVTLTHGLRMLGVSRISGSIFPDEMLILVAFLLTAV